ncbi:hypothetical protein IPJ72_04880 [Candidatus Peregrinibacteria bacterium]|nr:MAG: hypothetical protein IPJ72_04880 [Candidatus Peregrinibacteria bacterium]
MNANRINAPEGQDDMTYAGWVERHSDLETSTRTAILLAFSFGAALTWAQIDKLSASENPGSAKVAQTAQPSSNESSDQ